MVEFFLFQGGEETLHTGVVVAAPGATHALEELVVAKGGAEGLAGKLAAPVAQSQILCKLPTRREQIRI